MLSIPSGGPSLPARRRPRVLALLQQRDEARLLPGWLANVTPHVDGVVALDDGSSDGSAELLDARPEVLELLRVPADRPAWDEPGNHARLVRAALSHGADWLVALDADERLERDFRARAERVIRRGGLLGLSAYALRLHELWDSPDRFRADGIWRHKWIARLFRARADRPLDMRPLHARKTPLSRRGTVGRVAHADLRVYHLRMIDPGDRTERRERYERLDPDRLWQPGGYAYLTDETGVELRPIPAARGWVE